MKKLEEMRLPVFNIKPRLSHTTLFEYYDDLIEFQ